MPKKNPIKSKPQEVTAIGKALRLLGGLGGGIAGGYLGQPAAGSAAGTGLGAAISKWLGQGDYEVAKNTLVQRASNNIPMMHSSSQNVVVRHREFVTSINGSTAFTVQNSLTINPANATTFPWLSAFANRYSEYRILGMVYHYVPTSGTFNGSTAALGSVMLQTTYRATENVPVSKSEMLNEYWASETVPFETMAHPIECDPKENPFAVHYVRTVSGETNDPLLYDMGKTFIATQGMLNTDIVGDLFVTYEIELKKPVVNNRPLIGYSINTFSSAPTNTSYFNGVMSIYRGSNLGISFNTKTVNFPVGLYRFELQLYFAAGLQLTASPLAPIATITDPTKASFVNLDGLRNVLNFTATPVGPPYALLNEVNYTFAINVTAPTSVILPDLSGTINAGAADSSVTIILL